MSNENKFVIEHGVLKKYVGPGGDVVIPEGFTAIMWAAFYESPVERVWVPDTVRGIGRYAFAKCKKLKEIVLPDSLEAIVDNAFEDCSEDLVIPWRWNHLW